MADEWKPRADHARLSKVELEGRKSFYKMLLSPMPLEEKLDELGPELSIEDLTVLLKQFEEDEDYEICQAFKTALDERVAENQKGAL